MEIQKTITKKLTQIREDQKTNKIVTKTTNNNNNIINKKNNTLFNWYTCRY